MLCGKLHRQIFFRLKHISYKIRPLCHRPGTTRVPGIPPVAMDCFSAMICIVTPTILSLIKQLVLVQTMK